MMLYSDDHIALAAEYALGTLNADERALVETMMIVDPGFLEVVKAWDRKLAPLHQMVAPIDPPAGLWDKIKGAAVLPEGRVQTVLPEMPSEEAALESLTAPPSEPEGVGAAKPAADEEPVIFPAQDNVQARTRENRPTGSYLFAWLMTAIAAALAAILGLQAYRPALLPESLRAKPQIVEVKTPVAAAPQRIAALSRGAIEPAFILTLDTGSRSLTIRRVGASAQPGDGKSYELWMVSTSLSRPRSLGVIGEKDYVTSDLSSYDNDTVNNATYAVTLEQKGGSPGGAPTANPLWAGKLYATTTAR